MATLSYPTVDVTNARETVSHIRQSTERLLRRKPLAAGQIAAVTSMEVNRSRDGSAYVHAHCWLAIDMQDKPVSRTLEIEGGLAQWWAESARLSALPSVDWVRAYDPSGLMRYVLKPHIGISGMIGDPEFVLTLADQLAGVKLLSVSGALRGNAYRC